MLPTRTLLITEVTENTEENQWHGGIRGANGAGQKQKLCKQACQIFAFFSANPSLLGAIRANLRNPSLDFQKNDFAVHDFVKKSRGLFSNWRSEACF